MMRDAVSCWLAMRSDAGGAGDAGDAGAIACFGHCFLFLTYISCTGLDFVGTKMRDRCISRRLSENAHFRVHFCGFGALHACIVYALFLYASFVCIFCMHSWHWQLQPALCLHFVCIGRERCISGKLHACCMHFVCMLYICCIHVDDPETLRTHNAAKTP